MGLLGEKRVMGCDYEMKRPQYIQKRAAGVYLYPDTCRTASFEISLPPRHKDRCVLAISNHQNFSEQKKRIYFSNNEGFTKGDVSA